jgi:hypothetical protein
LTNRIIAINSDGTFLYADACQWSSESADVEVKLAMIDVPPGLRVSDWIQFQAVATATKRAGTQARSSAPKRLTVDADGLFVHYVARPERVGQQPSSYKVLASYLARGGTASD